MVHVLASVLHMNLSACVYRQSFWRNPQTAVSDYSLEGWAHRPCEFTTFAMPTVKLPRPPTKQSEVRGKCGSAKQIQLFHTSDSKQHLHSDCPNHGSQLPRGPRVVESAKVRKWHMPRRHSKSPPESRFRKLLKSPIRKGWNCQKSV